MYEVMKTVKEIEARIDYLTNTIIRNSEETISKEVKDPSKWADKIIATQERVVIKATNEIKQLYNEMDDLRFDGMKNWEQEEFMMEAMAVVDDSLPFE